MHGLRFIEEKFSQASIIVFDSPGLKAVINEAGLRAKVCAEGTSDWFFKG